MTPQEKYKQATTRIKASLEKNTIELDDIDLALDALAEQEAQQEHKILVYEEFISRAQKTPSILQKINIPVSSPSPEKSDEDIILLCNAALSK